MPQYHQDNTIPRTTHNGPEWIWVFGSNEAGRHGAGAAKVAKVNFRAEYGCGRGPTGKAYAIATKDKHLQSLALEKIEASVADFLQYSQLHSDLNFFVTRVGCGLAGYKDEEIGPMFATAPDNCSLPIEWKEYVVGRRVEALS